jgi:hypothetical protein
MAKPKRPARIDLSRLVIVSGIAVTTDAGIVRLGPGDDPKDAPPETNWEALLEVGAVEKE